MTITKLMDVKKTYFTKNKNVNVLENINIAIKEKTITVVHGQSGSGKTTLLNLMAATISPTKGSIYFRGINLTKLSLRQLSKFRNRKIGYLYQDYNLFPYLTVIENISLPAKIAKIDGKIIEDRVFNVTTELGVNHRLKNKPDEISGGQKARVGLARALINQPELLIMDEPTANLDKISTIEVIDFIRKKQEEENLTIIVSTHDKNILKFADDIYKIEALTLKNLAR